MPLVLDASEWNSWVWTGDDQEKGDIIAPRMGHTTSVAMEGL